VRGDLRQRVVAAEEDVAVALGLRDGDLSVGLPLLVSHHGADPRGDDAVGQLQHLQHPVHGRRSRSDGRHAGLRLWCALLHEAEHRRHLGCVTTVVAHRGDGCVPRLVGFGFGYRDGLLGAGAGVDGVVVGFVSGAACQG